MIAVPAAAQSALVDGTGKLYTLFALGVTGQPVRRWARSPRDITFETHRWSRLSPYVEARDIGAVEQEGTLSIILMDIDKSLHRNIDAHGERGNTVDLIRILDYPGGRFVTARYQGTTLRAKSFLNNDNEGYLLDLECADAASFPHRNSGVMTDDGYQRSLDEDDNSHIIATTARLIRWLRVRYGSTVTEAT